MQTTSSVSLRFDRFLAPAEAIRQSICLQPSSDLVSAPEDCTLGVFLEPTYDPVRRAVTYRLPAMAALIADTKYWLTVLAPTDASPFGFRAFDGASLESNVILQFTTAQTNSPGGPVDPALDDAAKRAVSENLFCVATSACAAKCVADGTACQDKCPVGDSACVANCVANVESCQKKKCPVSGSLVFGCSPCHSPIEYGSSAMGLDLSGANRISAVIGRVANQTQTGGNADEPDTKPRRFGRAMPHVEAGNAGNSYLLYKMLVGPIYARSAAAAGIAHGELERLRSSVVVGLPMPPSDPYAIPDESVDALSAWIATGAQTPVCP